ncbi:hypothetical protein OHR68_13840 [Spirillospora sp. NBC_00431]
MTMQKVRLLIERHIHTIVGVQVFSIIALWAMSVIIKPLQDWILTHSVFNLIIIVLLNDVLLRVVQIKSKELTANLDVFANEPEAYQSLRRYIDQNQPRQVDLIEYSTATIHDLLETLKSCRCTLRVLICDPDAAITAFQRDRINDRIRDLTTLTFNDYPTAEVRMYRLPASIRGRLFDGNYLTVGWHTYSNDSAGLYGHTNPMINIHTNTPEGYMMKTMFVEAFNQLWDSPSTTVLIGAGAEMHFEEIKDPETSREISERLLIEEKADGGSRDNE